jgi:hypothetical protein
MMTEQPPINPHVWRKFSQAQANFRKANNCSSVNGRWKWNGRKSPMKQRRRRLKWANAMSHWKDKLF